MSEEQGYNHAKLNREVYCPQCRSYCYTDQVNIKCSCGATLLTVVYSALTGKRIGEKDEDKTPVDTNGTD